MIIGALLGGVAGFFLTFAVLFVIDWIAADPDPGAEGVGGLGLFALVIMFWMVMGGLVLGAFAGWRRGRPRRELPPLTYD